MGRWVWPVGTGSQPEATDAALDPGGRRSAVEAEYARDDQRERLPPKRVATV